MEMRQYMPPQHVKFIEAAENGPSVRNFVMSSKNDKLKKLFNESVELVADFRALHLEYAGTYIHSQAQKHQEIHLLLALVERHLWFI